MIDEKGHVDEPFETDETFVVVCELIHEEVWIASSIGQFKQKREREVPLVELMQHLDDFLIWFVLVHIII